jgi:hypothetical protein
MSSGNDDTRSRAVQAALWNLRIDAAVGETVEGLRQRGVNSLVLKGRTFSDWYTPEFGKTYVDGDIWVAPGDTQVAEELLESLGFEPSVDESGLPEWWQEHASSWNRLRDQGKIDLHRRLQGVGVSPDQAWAKLWARREQVVIGGVAAFRLCEAGRALYATLHATHHGSLDPRGLVHLRAALDNVGVPVWEVALSLAEELDALEALAVGLRLVPAGVELARRIGVPDARSVTTTLFASSPPPVALGFAQLSGASGRRRLEILLRKLFPPPGFIRHWWPPAAGGRRMLLVGYLYRPIWLCKHAPAGYRAWRDARRRARSSS